MVKLGNKVNGNDEARTIGRAPPGIEPRSMNSHSRMLNTTQI